MGLLDVVIPMHDPARLDELNRAVFSAALQDHRPLALHVVCERFDAAALAAVRDNLAPILALAGDVALHVRNRSNNEPAGAPVSGSRGRFLAFLDDNGRIYAEGWRLLIAELAASGAAIAFGAVLNASVCREGVVPYVEAKHRGFQGGGLRELLRTVCPLHSFVLNRSCVANADVLVDKGIPPLEGYDLALRIVAQHPSSFHLADTVVGERLLNGGSNRAEAAEVERRKAGLVLSAAVQAQLGLSEPGLTVAAFLARAERDPDHGASSGQPAADRPRGAR